MYLTSEVINAAQFCSAADNFGAGAEVVFFGKIRNHSEGQKVLYLEYTAYDAMAERMIEECIQRAYLRWPIIEARILHRVGRVELGEIAVAIYVSAAHRDEAYSASRFLIERIKHQVPIWKKEYFTDGKSAWGGCCAVKGMAMV